MCIPPVHSSFFHLSTDPIILSISLSLSLSLSLYLSIYLSLLLLPAAAAGCVGSFFLSPSLTLSFSIILYTDVHPVPSVRHYSTRMHIPLTVTDRAPPMYNRRACEPSVFSRIHTRHILTRISIINLYSHKISVL